MSLKKALRDLLGQERFEQIAESAVQKRRTLGQLVSLTFDADSRIGWRAVEAMGLSADRIAQSDPEYVRNHLRRLYWLLSEESGGLCWRAPQAMAEIIRHRPKLFADYIPIVVHLIQEMAEEDLGHFRAGILWAIGRLGPLADEHVESVLPRITAALDDPDPQVRGMAVWCLQQVQQVELLTARPDLLADEEPVDLYLNGHLRRTTVRDLARCALDREVQEE